ncbi:hypothetical protein ABT381_00325 [Streptomyces sp. NPDC000151]|uniref:hypothetical protein n=1 Tax=Streptomyces sp. NPDC000151 TaxID=3154244 RepID=UPI00332220E7
MNDRTRRAARTVVQIIISLAAALPLLVDASGIPETAAGVGVALTVAAGITRLMQLPAVQPML